MLLPSLLESTAGHVTDVLESVVEGHVVLCQVPVLVEIEYGVIATCLIIKLYICRRSVKIIKQVNEN